MKTRTDFVSNSSSCSFVIAVNDSYKLDDFIADACKNCLEHAEDEDKAFTAQQDEFNKAVLSFHLRASELVYLGSLNIGKKRDVYTKGDGFFDEIKKDISVEDVFGGISNEVVENTDERVVLEYDNYVQGMAIYKNDIDYVTFIQHHAGERMDDAKKQKAIADEIVKFAKSYAESAADSSSQKNSATCVITKRTVQNTRALINAGYEVDLCSWEDLDKLEKILESDSKIYRIKVNNGGDGVDDDALFTFGGWDGEDVFDGLAVEVVGSEEM